MRRYIYIIKILLLFSKLVYNRPLIPNKDRNFSLFHCIQTSSGAYPTSYPVGAGVSFPRDKVAGA